MTFKISGCGHDVSSEDKAAADRSSFTNGTQVNTDNEKVLRVYLLSASVYSVHQLVSAVALLVEVQLELSHSLLHVKPK